MIIELDNLNVNRELDINIEVVKDEELDKRILDLKNSKVIGKIYLDSIDEINLECTFSGTMYIEDSISLKSVPYNFNIEINENLEEIKENYEECYEISKNTLDLRRVLWQNIVLEVPISYTEEKDANLKGDGWKLVNDNKKSDEIDPRLKKLEELLER